MVSCRHCNRDRPLRCRGLCKGCYGNQDIRKQYGQLWANGSVVKKRNRSRTPDTPTGAPIGSAWKIRVMEARADSGQGVFHPDDNQTAFLMVSERFWRKVVARWRRRQHQQREGDQ